MKRIRHTEEMIIQMHNEARTGGVFSEIFRRYGVSEATFYKWKQKYGGMKVSEASRFRLVNKENRKLQKLVADQSLDMMLLKELLSKKS